MLRARAVSLFTAWRSLCKKPGLIISIPLSKQQLTVSSLRWCGNVVNPDMLSFSRLDAHAEARIQQLRRATRWAKEHVCRDVVIFAGDRNFVRTDSERWTSSSSSWRPSLRMNAAWDEWLHSIGDAYEVPQQEFTWGRVNADQSEHATWIYETIDVVGSNRKFYSPGALRSFARRSDDLPRPRASVHWPMGLRWSGVRTRRKPQDSSDDIVPRPRPAWLLENVEFQRVADECFDSWFANREIGLAGLSSFVSTIDECATKFLSAHVIVAKPAVHKLELAQAAMRLLERHPIDERRLSRLCVADRDLAAIIELHVDLDSTSVPTNVLERLAERCASRRSL